MSKEIHLGFEIPTGEPVKIPLRHMIFTGQTQEAGKTTATEAVVARSGMRALTFITKPGEGSFTRARRIEPYFRERADWQFVASILEASRGEKLKYERAWIIRASKGARTLADVHRNVLTALKKAKGQNENAYLCLDAYLEAVVPQIAEVCWATSITLGTGINVMDLTGLNVEMQHLVIRSSLDWMLNKEKETLTIIPEAWKFIPQGRGTPVKLAAEAFIRQAAAMRNYLALDSQDIAGVEKMILKSVPLWILGVQREANEITRTLDQIPAGTKKPTKEQIATLGLGQFYVCHGTHTRRTYVWPEWMSEEDAQAIAMGKKHIAAKPHSPLGLADLAQTINEPKGTKRMSTDLEKRVEETNDLLRQFLQRGQNAQAAVDRALPSPAASSALAMPAAEMAEGEEGLYQRIKARLLAESPAILRIMVDMPEIQVQDVRRVITVKNTEPNGIFALMVRDGFFDSGATTKEVLQELRRRGKDCGNNVGAALCKDFANDGFLTFEKNGRFKSVAVMKKFIKD